MASHQPNLLVTGHDSVLLSQPPSPESYMDVNPTLLVSWWCTVFSLVIILIRVFGRWIRTERLYLEDKIMLVAILPLFARMVCVHFVLKYGTNNVDTVALQDLALIDGRSLEDEIAMRVVGSKLVLAARVFYTAFLWTAKLTIVDFLHRIYSQMWTRRHNLFLTAIRWFLVVTFVALVIATLAECQPFYDYWQVLPDPGPQCRQGYAQLITMGVCDSITDVLLVVFPIPIIVASGMKLERKISLSLLFSLSLILVAITIYRVQATIAAHSNQPFRSLLASFEILAATGVANAIVLGSFLRDRGAKKAKFKFGSTGGDSYLDRPTMARTRSGQAHIRGQHSWGSDVDLFEDVGMRPAAGLRRETAGVARPAPAVLPLMPLSKNGRTIQKDWAFPVDKRDASSIDTDRQHLRPHDEYDSEPGSPTSPNTPGHMTFFDVGGLLDGGRQMHAGPSSDCDGPTFSDVGGLLLKPKVSSQSDRSGPMFLDVGGLLSKNDTIVTVGASVDRGPGTSGANDPSTCTSGNGGGILGTRGRRRRQSSVSFAPLPSESSMNPLIEGERDRSVEGRESPTKYMKERKERLMIGSNNNGNGNASGPKLSLPLEPFREDLTPQGSRRVSAHVTEIEHCPDRS